MNYLKSELYDLIKKDPTIFDFIQEAAFDGLWYWDLENPENEWMNPKFWKVLGYNHLEMPHKVEAWIDKIHPEDLNLTTKNVKENKDDTNPSFDQVVRYFHKDGHTVWIRCQGMVIQDENGKPTRVLGAHNEITDLKKKEQLLLETNRIAKIGYWEFDLEKSLPIWSEVTREIHEVPDDYKPNLKDALSFYKEGTSRERITSAVAKAISEGQSYDEELELTTYTGKSKWVRTIGLPEFSNDKCIRLYGLFQDIDDNARVRLEIDTEKLRYEQIITGANLGSWELNLRTDEISLNNHSSEMLGYENKAFKEKFSDNWFALIHPDDQSLFQEKLENLKNQQSTSLHLDCRIKKTTEEWIWLRINAKLFPPSNYFKEPRIVGTLQDVNSEKESNKHLYTFITDAPMALAMMDKEMRYMRCSQRWLSDYALEIDTIEGKSHYSVFPEISDQWKALHQRCLNGETLNKDEDLFIRQDGTKHWLRWKIKTWYQSKNEVGGIIIFSEIITSQKETEEKLILSERSFRENFTNAAIGMAILDTDGKWLKANNTLCHTIGYTEKEMQNLTSQAITHPADLAIDLEHLKKLNQGEIQNYQIEKRYIHKNKKIVQVLLGAAAVRDQNGKILNYIFQIVDISKRKIGEKQIETLLHREQERTQRLNSFAYIVSHNLRNHSSGIATLLQFLEDETPQLREAEAFKFLEKASHGLSTTIDHLNEIVEIEGITKDSFVSCNLQSSLNNALSSLRLQVQNSKIRIRIELKEYLCVQGLDAYLESIFFNFISNAIKYRHPERKAELAITALVAKPWVCISFTDNGLGIDLERHKERLFGMYNTFHSNPEARGLGLFLTHRQVQMLGGRIEVSSIEDAGSEFKIYLPYEKN
jgi:PAS domain S-box-containing protein